MLKIDSVRATYENNTVLNDLSYTFEDKNKYALIGTSGIGKTTLLNILCGIRKADGGTVISDYSRPSYIFQDPRLFPWMTALENVELVCNDKERAKDILLSLLKDTNALKNFPNELSGGMKQRVSIARALAYDGDIVFMDEPFQGLDAETRQEVRKLVFESLADKTVIMITHDIEDTKYCDVILRLCGSPVTELLTEESGSCTIE